MHFRAGERQVPLSAEDLETIDRLMNSEHLLDFEKNELEKSKAAESKGAFEQESLGRPKSKWPYY
jgi:hypothetical protein